MSATRITNASYTAQITATRCKRSALYTACTRYIYPAQTVSIHKKGLYNAINQGISIFGEENNNEIISPSSSDDDENEIENTNLLTEQNLALFGVFRLKGCRQYKVSIGDVIYVDSLLKSHQVGDIIECKDVLLIGSPTYTIVGQPNVVQVK